MSADPSLVSHSEVGPRRTSWLVGWLRSPLLWGGLLTVGFYSLIPWLPVYRELAERYFCGHPLEYVTAALFFMGVAILGIKRIGLAAEHAALAADPLAETESDGESADPLRQAAALEGRLNALPARCQRTHLVERLRRACGWIRARHGGEGLEDHLRHLADQAADRTYESYGFVRTITWAIPIIGFLGTVQGITIAVANLSVEQIATSLGDVAGGLAVAFDTTSLALSLSLVFVFLYFSVERSEQQILARVEDYAGRRLPRLFPTAVGSPLAEAEAQAARQLLDRTEQLITWQAALWQESLEGLRQRWTGTLESQRTEMAHELRQGMAATLDDHARQLSAVRGEFLEAFRGAAEAVQSGMAESRHAQRELLDELRRQAEILLQIVGEEEQLARLQGRLADNLDALRAVNRFEETLHSLTAAVHLLTARARPAA